MSGAQSGAAGIEAATFNAVEFRTEHPYDVVPRALDTLRKMDFRLIRLAVGPSEDAFRVEVQFLPTGRLAPSTFVERLRLFDLWDVNELDLAASSGANSF